MVLVIDGNNLANMCSFAAKKRTKQLTNNDGEDVTTVDVFMSRLYNYYDNLYPDDIIICWDKKLTSGVQNFRKLEVAYKANRSGDNVDLYRQCDLIEKITTQLGIRNMHPNIMEADDVIAWIAHNSIDPILIASFDKDLLQLVNHNVEYYDLRRRVKVTVQNFEEVYEVMRTRFLLYKMVLGDRSDNILGLKGYGKVKSKRLAESDTPFKDLSQDQIQLLIRNKKLMDLREGYTEYPDEATVYSEQYTNIPVRDFDKFIALGVGNNIQYIKNYKYKWEDVYINT